MAYHGDIFSAATTAIVDIKPTGTPNLTPAQAQWHWSCPTDAKAQVTGVFVRRFLLLASDARRQHKITDDHQHDTLMCHSLKPTGDDQRDTLTAEAFECTCP